MEFGIFLTMPSPAAQPSREIYDLGVELVLRAESLGFTRAWLAEHHFTTYSYSSRPLLFLAYLAARTSRIRLGTAIVPLPLHQPLLVAEEVATIDILSGGRVDLGLGKGYQKYQFDRLGVEKRDDAANFFEPADVIRLALLGEPFVFEGQHLRLPETRIFPQPLQQPVPLWCVVNTQRPEMLHFAIERGMNLFTGVLEPISRLRNVRKDLGDTLSRASRIGTQRPVFVSRDPKEIEIALEEVRWNARVSVSQRHNFGQVIGGRALAEILPDEPTSEQILEDYVVFGSPEECVRQLRRIQEGVGCDCFNASFWFGALPADLIRRSMDLFAAEVMPAFS
ncbi:MAG TPA: LLM class flavin-dependent oxidoreductase [Chthoniobacter sp.]|jgi:alkanesulfonate monooxygenase SsuD/methylene tetrahydromethanopterin reductase-like flavin-dependent oxidoreductase (luciferase family)